MGFMESVETRTVQEVAEKCHDRIPDRYIRPVEERPTSFPASNDAQIPVVDLAELEVMGDKRVKVVREIGRACETWGFFQVINHGVPPSVVQQMLNASQEFFSMPSDDRMAYYSTDLHAEVAYGTSFNPSLEKYLQWRDYLAFPGLPFPEVVNKWPTKPSSFRESAVEFSKGVINLSKRLLAAISESLNLDSDYLAKALGEEHRLTHLINFYPRCPNPDLALGLVGHSDPNVITVLMQDQVGGLQVFNNDRWVAVKPIPEAFVINVADILEMMTNGRYKSVEHRAVANAERSRMSVVSLYEPSHEVEIEPISEVFQPGGTPGYKPVKYVDFRKLLYKGRLDRKSALDVFRINHAE